MKYLSQEQKAWNVLHLKLEERRKRKSKERRKARLWGKKQGVGDYKRVPLEVPRNFNMRENIEEALGFFDLLRNVILVRRKLGLIDFSLCESISAGAGLILAAEADRCRQLRFRDGNPTLVTTYPADAGMRHFLNDLGFFKLLNMQVPVVEADDYSQSRFIAMRSGRRDKGQELHYVTEVLGTDSVQLDGPARQVLYEGLLEAMNNVTTHAYSIDGTRKYIPTLSGQWWAAGHWDNKRREVGALIYDQGVGIPATLPNTQENILLDNIRRQFHLGTTDAELIRVAMEIGKSRFDGQNRGRGMESLRRAVSLANAGHLLILSGSGGYGLQSNGTESMFPLSTDVSGTYIEWRIGDQDLLKWE